MNTQKKPSLKQAALSILIGIMGCVSSYMPILLLLMPALLGFVFAAWGSTCLVIGAGTAAILSALLLGPADALAVLTVFLPAALFIGHCLKKQKPYRTAVIGAALFLGLGYYCLICLPGMLSGEGPFRTMEQFFLTMADTLSAEAEPFLASGLVPQEEFALITDTVRSMSLMAAELTVGSITLLAMGFGLVDVLVARLLAKPAMGLRPMAPFHLWQLSKQFHTIAFAAMAAALAVHLLSLSNAGAVLIAAECVVLLPMVLMGLCLLAFLFKIPGAAGKVRKVLMAAAIVLLMPYSLAFLLVMGFFDRILRIRKRVRLPKGDDPNSKR